MPMLFSLQQKLNKSVCSVTLRYMMSESTPMPIKHFDVCIYNDKNGTKSYFYFEFMNSYNRDM